MPRRASHARRVGEREVGIGRGKLGCEGGDRNQGPVFFTDAASFYMEIDLLFNLFYSES